MQDIRRHLAPLALMLAVLVIASRWAAGDRALPVVSLELAGILGFVVVLNLLHFVVVAVLASMVRARRFQNPRTRQVDVRAVWASLTINPVASSLGVVGLIVGITACANLVEIYRTRSAVWHDATLWNLERELFAVLLASPLNVPAFWDRVYFMVWSGLFLGASTLFVTGQKSRFFLLTTTLVWAFVLTRVTAIYFPTQGPVFFKPEVFDLSGTISAETQRALSLYMAGEIRQNGLLPGTMAMPSLHVAMPFLVMCLLAPSIPHTLWVTAPWFLLNWASTVFLGWHYAVDGVGGVAVALIALGLAWIQQRAWDSLLGGKAHKALQPTTIETRADGLS
jgi:hypothetical protein